MTILEVLGKDFSNSSILPKNPLPGKAVSLFEHWLDVLHSANMSFFFFLLARELRVEQLRPHLGKVYFFIYLLISSPKWKFPGVLLLCVFEQRKGDIALTFP